MIDILLISPSNEKLGLFHSFVPRSVPLALGILASYIMKFNYNPEIVDEEIVIIDEEFIKNKMEFMAKPRIFGISIMTTNASKSYAIAQIIKKLDKDAIILAGGIHPTVVAEEVLQKSCIDFVICREGEKAVLTLIEKIKTGDKDYSDIKNIVFKAKNDDIVYNAAESEPFDVNELPIFPYHLFDKKKYDLGFILSSRGCPYNCIFCSQRAITGGKYRARNNEMVIQELEYLINVENQKNITFFDDFFTGDKKRVFELCKMIREKNLHKKCSFGVQTRGDSVNREILEEMKKSGFDSLMFGFETSSNHLMKVINKRETVEDNINAIKLGKELGFSCEATFIFGFPEENYQDRINALKIAKSTGLDRARFNNATPYPGTEFYNIALSQNKLNQQNNWDNFSSAGAVTASLFKPFQVPYCPEETNPKDLVGEVFLANLLFYINMSKLKALFNVKKSGSGKWFELPESKFFDINMMFNLIMLGLSVGLRAIYFVLFSKECRKFFFESFRTI